MSTSTAVFIKVQKTTQSRIKDLDFNHLSFGKVFSDHMFVADYKNGKWDDCQIVPYAPFQMSPAAAVLHYGQAIFG
jgi:branched-chain amino acid aminotransferase